MEQQSGSYTIEVSHKGTLLNSQAQNYSLIISVGPPPPISSGLLIDEDFSGGLPADWSVDAISEVSWEIKSPIVGDLRYDNNTGGAGNFAMMDFGPWVEAITSLRTPTYDLSSTEAAVLRFKNYFLFDELETINVDVSTNGGADWSNAWQHLGGVIAGQVALDLSGAIAGEPSVTLRFRFENRDWGYPTGNIWQLDDVELEVFGGSVPPPPPGGDLPGLAINPNPADGDSGLGLDTNLSWSAGPLATSHDVYFGASNPPVSMGNRADASFDPGTLAYDTTYYWRIDEVNSDGATPGNTWSFTTEEATPNVAPTANFTFSTNDLTASFTDSSSDSDGSVVAWSWDFGDGSSTSAARNPSHAYASAGTYTVTLTATDDESATDTFTNVSVTVTAPPTPNVAPTANFTFITNDLTANFTDTSSDSDGSVDTWSWDFGDGSSTSTARNPSHTYASAATYTVTLTVTDDDGDTDAFTNESVTVTAPPSPPPYVDQLATAETPVAGTVSGSYLNTQSDDVNNESITETDSGGNPAKNRYSYLEHIWHLDVSPGNLVTLTANTWSSGSSEGDNFVFAYSLDDGSSYTDMFTVSSTNNANVENYQLPGSINGTVWVRVRDADRTPGNRVQDMVFVDYLVIRSEAVAGDPPADPSGLTATAASSSQINLVWTDNADNESGFHVERSADGSSWTEIATVVANVNSFSDTGLTASTTYHYQVVAYNVSGTSGYTNTASAETLTGADITLNATGYKVKGVQYADLRWSGATSVAIYRDERFIKTTSDSPYTDNIGNKGGGSYTYEVCDTDNASNCASASVVF